MAFCEDSLLMIKVNNSLFFFKEQKIGGRKDLVAYGT